jgi:peroxiredoxin
LRVHQLIQRLDEFDDNFTIVAIFDSPLENLQKQAQKHHSPFPVLADEKNTYYKKYGIEHSVFGMLKGIIIRMPSLLYAMFVKGYIPLPLKGSLTTIPADFLVDENGTIQIAYYGKDEGDHLPIDELKIFSQM